MKKLMIILILLFFSNAALSQYKYQEIIHLPWGENDTEIGFRKAPGGQFGPMSFSVENDTILFLDTQNQSIKLFKNRSLLNKINLPVANPDDFSLKTSNHFFLLSENSVLEVKNQVIIDTYSPNSPREIITSLIQNKDNNIYAVLNESHSVNLQLRQQQVLSKSQGVRTSKGDYIQIAKKDWQTIRVQINQNYLFDIASESSNLGAARFLGTNQKGELYIYLEKIKQQVPLRVDREIRLYNKSGELRTKFIIPTHSHTYIFKEFYIDKKGDLYHMISAEEGIYVIRWIQDGELNKSHSVYYYPPKFQSYYHYNLAQEKDTPSPIIKDKNLKKKDNSTSDFPPVTRAEALAIGDTYVQHVWTASSNNLTYGRILDPNGVQIETPSWVQVGTNYKVPYQWGGFYTLPGFDQGLLDGKFAGDIATTGVSSFSVGVDCSGFVSRCWKLLSHYSTRMMDDYIAAPYSSWDQLKPADAVHKPGHVRLFVDFNPNGSLLTVEASGRDWRVNYRTFYLSDLSEYMPRYYIFMEGMPGSLPKPDFTSVCFEDSVNISWQIAENTSTSGFHLYSGQNEENWILLADPESLPSNENSKNIELHEDEAHFFKMMSVSSLDDSTESYPTDTYGYFNTHHNEKILIVDGFDRTNGSYPFPYHSFAMTMGKALAYFNYSFETVSNDAVFGNDILLENYDAVIWMLGDESTQNETFSDEEQNLVKSYLQQGGKMFITGSEIAWDLDNKGSSSDKSFFHNFLKASYHLDDSEDYSVYGESGTVFEGLTIQFDDGTKGIYEEDWPDAFQVANGSYAALKYGNGLIAATAFEGIVPNGTQPAKVLLLGFPFETIYDKSDRISFLGRVLDFFDLTATPVTEQPSQSPHGFVLHGNYPNPFNTGTFIQYQLFQEERVLITIFDILGKKVKVLFDDKQKSGNQKIYWDGLDDQGQTVTSGIFVYQIQAGAQIKSKKMMLLK